MGDFIQELKSNKILNSGDIIRLRTYIKNKYPDSDVKQQADILINSIRTIIDGYLRFIPVDQQTQVREELLKNTLLSNQQNILLHDLFLTITSTYTQEDNASSVVLDWVNYHLDKPINKDELLEHFSHLASSDEICSNNLYSENLSFQPSITKVLFVGLMLVICFSLVTHHLQSNSVNAKEENINIEIEAIKFQNNHLLDYFRYKDIDENKLKAYLKSRDSLLEEEPYFSSIINTAQNFDLNPLILFAIAGHEQGFVPKSNPLSNKIVNNPFNVFVSWQEYNTDIIDSSQIAARTVINLSKDRPDEIDPFQWINRKYAEDKNWWKGVRSIFNHLEREVNNFTSE